jgi:RNA polymerase sigma-70 factor (ECF subfamily)
LRGLGAPAAAPVTVGGDGSPRGDDDALLAASAAGDARSFRSLVDRHGGRAYAVALRLTGSPADAEDVVQEAFLRAWRRASSWRPSGSGNGGEGGGGGARFPTWLYQVVLNLCRDRARAGRLRRHEPLEAEEAQAAADPRPDAEADLGRRREAAGLVEAVRRLPERQRAALVLTYAGGLSNVEAAAALGVSVGAVESLLVRARRDLRGRLRQTGPSSGDGDAG